MGADRLHAEPLREKAWGAYLAAVCHMPELAGEIGAELERLSPEVLVNPTWNSESFWVGHSMLDALIELREPLPSSVLATVAKGLEIEYLAELAQISKPEVERSIEPQTAVRWSNLLQLNAEIHQALKKQETALKQLAKSLISAGALDSSEPGIRLHVEIQIEDQRSSRSVPLPQYAPVEFRIHLTSDH